MANEKENQGKANLEVKKNRRKKTQEEMHLKNNNTQKKKTKTEKNIKTEKPVVIKKSRKVENGKTNVKKELNKQLVYLF